MPYDELYKLVSNTCSRFDDGRTNYRSSRINLVIGAMIVCWDYILILKRSDKVLTYPNMWDFVWWYLDDGQLPEEKITEEIREEIWVSTNDIISIRRFRRVIQYDDVINKVWVNFPLMVIIKHDASIVLDDEHSEYRRIKRAELDQFNLVPWTLELYTYIQTFTSFY